MAWIEKKEDWLPGRSQRRNGGRPERVVEKVYSVAEVAAIMSVSKRTVWKWLSMEEPEGAVIPSEAWFKLPGTGHIRIREWIVLKLQRGDI